MEGRSGTIGVKLSDAVQYGLVDNEGSRTCKGPFDKCLEGRLIRNGRGNEDGTSAGCLISIRTR